MPTGYTADVKDGTLTDFPTFAMRCARAFGALIEMRDDAMDAPIPAAFAPSSYHQDALKEARAKLARLRSLSILQVKRAAEAAFAESMKGWQASHDEGLKARQRYEAMLVDVRAWEPPTADHAELKRFMESQLSESIKFDCGHDEERWKPKQLQSLDWFAQEVERTEKDITYHQQHLDEDVKRAAERTQWVQQLRDSLRNVARADHAVAKGSERTVNGPRA